MLLSLCAHIDHTQHIWGPLNVDSDQFLVGRFLGQVYYSVVCRGSNSGPLSISRECNRPMRCLLHRSIIMTLIAEKLNMNICEHLILLETVDSFISSILHVNKTCMLKNLWINNRNVRLIRNAHIRFAQYLYP